MSDVIQPNESGLTRRDLLKSGAILGGALAWGAPVVQLIGMKPAMAQVVSDSCPALYCLKAEYNPGTGELGLFEECSAGVNRNRGRGGQCLTLPGDTDDLSPVPQGILDALNNGGVSYVDDCGDPGGSGGVPGIRITLPATCRLAGMDNAAGSPDAFVGDISAAAKCGRIEGIEGDANEGGGCYAPHVENGDLCFPIVCGNGNSISHIELLICCGDPVVNPNN